MAFLRLGTPPVADHPHLAEREGDEDVDGVHHHQGVDRAVRVQQHEEGRAAHQQHAVLHGEAVAERAEPVRQEGILRQVGHHAGAGDESGLGGDEQQQRLGGDGDEHVPLTHRQRAEMERACEHLRQPVVHRLPRDRMDAHQQIPEDDPAGGHGEAGGHVDHRPLAGEDARLAHDREAVRDRLDSGVRARAQRVGAQEQQRKGDEPHGAEIVREAVRDAARHLVGAPEMEADASADQDDVREQESEEDGQQDPDRFLHAAQVEDRQRCDRGQLDRQLPHVPVAREVAEDRLASCRD